MKKIITSSMAVLLAGIVMAQPQHREGPMNPPSVAERWKRDSIKLQLYVVLNNSQAAAAKTAFLQFYTDMDGLMGKDKAAPPTKEAVDGARTKRDNTLKSVFNTGQFDRFQTFEREFMPPPPPPHPRPGGEKPSSTL